MLNTQVAYWANQENKRHNLAMERLDQSKLDLDASKLDEQVKYWSSQVQHWQNELSETTRHNLITEGYTAKEIGIKQKQAKAALQQAQAALKNAETNRQDLMNKAKQAEASYRQSTASLQQAYTAYKRQLVDEKRSDYQNALDVYKMLETLSQSAKNRADADKARQAAEKLQKEIKHYEYEHVWLPTMKASMDNATKILEAILKD